MQCNYSLGKDYFYTEMRGNMTKKKPGNKKQAQKLKKDLKEIHNDWKELYHQEDLAHDEEFLGKIAGDIISLDEDAHLLTEDEDFYETADLLTHLLETPWGAPFVSNTTLMDAALCYSHQDPKDCDLGHLMENFYRYGHQFENQLFKIFEDVLDDFEYQSF